MKNTTAVILILISIGVVYTYVMPEYSKIQSLRAEAAGYNDVIANVSDLTQKRDELLLKYNAIPKTELDNLNKILPDNVNVVELALNLDSIASKYGISIKGVKTVDVNADPGATAVQAPSTSGLQKVRITFSFVSNYESFRKFLSDLEQSLRLIEVRTVSFGTSDTGLDDFQMQIETYWLK